jgi:hypothetical protein
VTSPSGQTLVRAFAATMVWFSRNSLTSTQKPDD